MESGTMTRSPAEEQLAAEAQGADANGSDAGVVVGEGALEGEGAEEQGGLPPLELEGTGQQLSLKIAGQRPDKATAKMVGGKIDIPAGEFQPGDVIEVISRIRCTRVAVIHKMNNATGDVNEVEREHQFKVMSIEKTG